MDTARAYFAMPAFPHGPWPQRESVRLAAVPSSVSRFRARTREMLWEWKLDFLADDAELIVSELASNSVRATSAARGQRPSPAGHVAVRLLADPSRLLILVWDLSPCPPVLPAGTADDEEESGRGLLLVGALAACWHWYNPSGPHGGKVTWALLEAALEAEHGPAGGSSPRARAGS